MKQSYLPTVIFALYDIYIYSDMALCYTCSVLFIFYLYILLLYIWSLEQNDEMQQFNVNWLVINKFIYCQYLFKCYLIFGRVACSGNQIYGIVKWSVSRFQGKRVATLCNKFLLQFTTKWFQTYTELLGTYWRCLHHTF